ncbi:TetR/AcrR family transcriptional regulator [Ottowia thiooxydans]|uniref:AcrR family transcriptional regulator n=1 Tax=Ottowia thiooxydans TaxID=219182 RepID=A0ABV2QAJ3_9BURK
MTLSKRTPPTAAADSEAPADFAQPAGALTPRRMRRAAEILVAARDVFLEKGFDRSSVGEIAAKVGVVEGLVYSYYPSKRDLLNAVLRGMYEPLIADLEDKFSRLQGVRSRMRFLIWRHLRVYVEEPNLSRLVLHEVRTGPEYFQSVLHDLHVRYTAFLLRTVEEGIAHGELRPDTDVELLRSMVYGGIEHRMWGTLFGRGTVDVEAMADRYTTMVLGSVLTGSSVQAPAPASHGHERAHLGQVLNEVRARLDQIEQAVMASPEISSVPAKAGQPKARHGKKASQ